MAVGIGLVFGVLRLVNFAYGQLIMAGAFALAFTPSAAGRTWSSILACFGGRDRALAAWSAWSSGRSARTAGDDAGGDVRGRVPAPGVALLGSARSARSPPSSPGSTSRSTIGGSTSAGSRSSRSSSRPSPSRLLALLLDSHEVGPPHARRGARLPHGPAARRAGGPVITLRRPPLRRARRRRGVILTSSARWSRPDSRCNETIIVLVGRRRRRHRPAVDRDARRLRDRRRLRRARGRAADRPEPVYLPRSSSGS